MSSTVEISPKPAANPRKLQKKPRQLPIPVPADNEYSPSIPSLKARSNPVSKLPQPSVTATSYATKTGNFKTHIPFPSPAFKKDANKPRPILGPQATKAEISKTTPEARIPTLRNASNAGSGLALSPLSSPTRPSPGPQLTEPAADFAAGSSFPNPSPGITDSRTSNRTLQQPHPSVGGTKQIERTKEGPPALANGQRQKRQRPRPVGISDYSSSHFNTMASSCSPSQPINRAEVEARDPKRINSPYHPPLRESTYPTPLADSPLTDTAFDLHQSGHDSSISTGSSSSSLGRLLRRVPQKPSVAKLNDRPSTTTIPTLPRRSGTLDGYNPLPYEAIRDAGEPPIHVASPVTPTVISYATTPVEALPGVSNNAPLQFKKDSKTGGSWWSLFRNRSKSSGAAQRAHGLQRTLTANNAPSSICNRGEANGHLDDNQSHNHRAGCEGHQRANGVLKHVRLCRPHSSNNSLPPTNDAQRVQPTDHYAEKQLPPSPVAPIKPTISRAPPNTRCPSRESLKDTATADEQAQIQRHRRRALFALDGVTYPGTSRSSFLPQTIDGQNEQRSSQRRPPPPPPPKRPPRTSQLPTSSNSQATATSSCSQTKMSEAMRREFVRRGKEAEARVSAHARAMEATEAQFSSSSAASGLDLDYPAPEQLEKSLKLPVRAEAPIVSAHRADVAWWEVGDTDTARQTEMTASPNPGKKAVLDQAVVELENAAVATAGARVEDDGGAGDSQKYSLLLRQQIQTAGETPTGASQVSSPQQRRDEQKSCLRGRQLTREVFRRHREGGRWNLASAAQQHGSPSTTGNEGTIQQEQQQHQITVHIPHGKSEGAPLHHGPASNGNSSTSSSSASLRSTALRNGKPRPFMNAYEAAHAVQSTSVGALSQVSLGLSTEQKRLMHPEPLSWRSEHQSEIGHSPDQRLVSLPSEHDDGNGQRAGAPAVTETTTGATSAQRRPPPPPPPQTPKAAVAHTSSPNIESGTQGHAKPKRRPPSPPPIPPKSGLRPRLGGDWSGTKLQGLKSDILSPFAHRRNLSNVGEAAAAREQGQVASRFSRSSGWTSDVVQARESDGGGDESSSDSERFWSEDEGEGGAGGTSKETTPEKMGEWLPPEGVARVEEGMVGKKDISEEGSTNDDENQVVDYYLDAQREEEEQARRVADQDAKKAAAAQAEEEARKREDEERRQRVANLLARVRAGDMN